MVLLLSRARNAVLRLVCCRGAQQQPDLRRDSGGAKSTYTVGGYQRDHWSAWKAGVENGGGVDFGTPAFSLGVWKSAELRCVTGGGSASLDGGRASAIPSFPPGPKASLALAVVDFTVPVKFAHGGVPPLKLTWKIACIAESGCKSNSNSEGASVTVVVRPPAGV